jgi:hypothetical protein
MLLKLTCITILLDFGDDLEIPKRNDVYLKNDQKPEDFYEIQEKLGE